MALSYGKVGIAPGTTTMTLGTGGTSLGKHGEYTQQDPGVTVRNAYGQLMDSYFDARPTDFEMAPYRGYLPVQRGWVTGKLSGLGCGNLGDEVTEKAPVLSPEERAEFARLLQKLELEQKTHAIKETRSRRFWGSVIGIAAGTSAVLGVLNYLKTR